MKLTTNKLNELHVAGFISDVVYDQYTTLLLNDEDVDCNTDPDGKISFRVHIQPFKK